MFGSIKNALDNLANQQKGNAQAKSNLIGYKQSLIRMLADMRLDPHEIAALKAQKMGLALGPQAVSKIHVEIVSSVIDHIFADGIVTHEELEQLNQILGALAVNPDQLPASNLGKIQLAAAVINIQKGILPGIPPQQSSVNLVPGEVLHCQIHCQILDERTYRQYVGGSSSVSFRIMKGVSYRIGSSRGRSIPVTQIVPIDRGTFLITSKRLAYVGQRQSFSFDWDKVLAADPFEDGMVVASTARKKSVMIQYGSTPYNEIIEAVTSFHINR